MTLKYRLFGIHGNSEEVRDKIDGKIERLKGKVRERRGRIEITHQIDAFSIEGITHYACYLKIKSKGVYGSVSVPVTGRNYPDGLENDPRISQMKNDDCANTYEQALDFAKRFTDEGLEVLVEGKSLEEINGLIPKIRGGEVSRATMMIPHYF